MEKANDSNAGVADIESETMGENEMPRDVNIRHLADGAPDLVNQHDQLQRGLKSRHIQFLALGGA